MSRKGQKDLLFYFNTIKRKWDPFSTEMIIEPRHVV